MNVIERVNEEIKRRSRVAGAFPSEGFLLRLVERLKMKVKLMGVNRKTLTSRITYTWDAVNDFD